MSGGDYSTGVPPVPPQSGQAQDELQFSHSKRTPICPHMSQAAVPSPAAHIGQ